MKSAHFNQSRKRAVNLTLNEALVTQAKKMTSNLSGVVEQLLTDYVEKQNKARQAAVAVSVFQRRRSSEANCRFKLSGSATCVGCSF